MKGLQTFQVPQIDGCRFWVGDVLWLFSTLLKVSFVHVFSAVEMNFGETAYPQVYFIQTLLFIAWPFLWSFFPVCEKQCLTFSRAS